LIPNFTYEELAIGQSARLLRTLTMQDIQAFAAVCGDANLCQFDSEYANGTLASTSQLEGRAGIHESISALTSGPLL
jgi:acyl dehydratase